MAKQISVSNTFEVISLEKGEAGNGIASITEYYLASSSSSGITVASSGWTTEIQYITSVKRFLWNYEVITFTDGTIVTTTPILIGAYGLTGAQGKGISSITEYYLAASISTGITTSSVGWRTSMPTLTSTYRYLWNYEVIVYTDGSSSSTAPVIIGVYGDKGDNGANGKGISSIVEYYLATSVSTGITTSSAGWSTTVPTITSVSRYLWNYRIITYTDGTTSTTTPVVIGVYGDPGQNGENGDKGDKGDKGAKERIRKWAVGVNYTAGGDGEEYGDIVYMEGSNIPYECVVSHISSASYPPNLSVGVYWRVGEYRYMVANDIHLSRLILASEIDVENITAQKLSTSGNGATLVIQNGILEIFGSNKNEPNIRFGVDANGNAVLQYFDNNGNFLYDLGPTGMSSLEVREAKFIAYRRKYLGSDLATLMGYTSYKNVLYNDGANIYKYVSAMINGINQDSNNDGLYFTSQSVEGSKVNGWYCQTAAEGASKETYLVVMVGADGTVSTPSDQSAYNPSYDPTQPVYYKRLEHYTNGILDQTQNIYFN